MDQLISYLNSPWVLWIAAGVVSLILSKRSQIDEWANSSPRVAGVMKLLRSVGLDPWLLMQSLSLIIRGRLPNPPAPKSASKLPPMMLVVIASILVGCASPKPVPSDPSERAAYFAAAVRDAVKAKADAKRLLFAVEAKSDAAIREACSQVIALRDFLPDQQTVSDVDSMCRGYVTTEPPAELAPEPVKEPEPVPEAPVETDAGVVPA